MHLKNALLLIPSPPPTPHRATPNRPLSLIQPFLAARCETKNRALAPLLNLRVRFLRKSFFSIRPESGIPGNAIVLNNHFAALNSKILVIKSNEWLCCAMESVYYKKLGSI
jgi:hypothetical protein